VEANSLRTYHFLLSSGRETGLLTAIAISRYFAGEIIGGVLEVEARRWRRPKRLAFSSNQERVVGYRTKYQKFDWTGMLGQS
jgi:hypothetical protein